MGRRESQEKEFLKWVLFLLEKIRLFRDIAQYTEFEPNINIKY